MDPTTKAAIAASASFVFITLLFAALFFFCKKPPQKLPQTRTRTTRNPSLTSITISESRSFDPSLNQISMPDLIVATRNFAADRIVGDGSFGLVYKARLNNGVKVAVKKLSKDAFQGFREFEAEMETLGTNSIRHPNLVRILGYCVSGDDRILIYEFMEKGSLDQWLHDTSSKENVSSNFNNYLSWKIRIKIIKGVADGLLFLHTLETPIIHRDIKASNVLLDSELKAHIADFGLARRMQACNSHVSTQVAGTMGYMPPEYRSGLTNATAKADVYSFGILMIEIATGKRPNLPTKMEDGKDVGLEEWARTMVAQGREIEMIDPVVSRDGLPETEVKELLRIAHLCTSEISKERPTMQEVVTLLKQLSL